MQKKPRAGILFLTIMMLWGIIYPQYALTEEMYETVQTLTRWMTATELL